MLLMTGVTGAFLTGDLFNLYVWFEVLLISSFGLLVLGSEKRQIDGTLKYGVLNLMATTLFLIAVGLTYGRDRHAQHGRYREQGARAARGRADGGRSRRCSCSPSG